MSKTIFVIEDDMDTRQLLEEVFMMKNCKVDSAETAHEAVAYLRSNPSPDIILSDLHVPGAGSSGEIVEIIRANLKNHSTKIYLLSGHADLRNIADTLNVGFMEKPVDLNELLKLTR